ncbi:MAG: cytochrome P450 [Planktomarina sp.]
MPPKPTPRAGKVSLWQYMKLFRQDILSAQPAKLYRAWMAEFRTPFFRSYMVNQPELVKHVLNKDPDNFPKSGRVAEGLRPLLGNSVFLTNGQTWKRQRRIIDPAFEGGRLRETYPAMWDAAGAAVHRMGQVADGPATDIEEVTSFAAADVIFRTLFSLPIEDQVAGEVFHEFRTYQRSAPVLNIAAVLPLPWWMPRGFGRATKDSAKKIRALITKLTMDRWDAIQTGNAPDDLATKIMTTADPETGQTFTPEEMVDQVAIFFLAGHETSASALAWALYLLALYPDWQDQIATEGAQLIECKFEDIRKLKTTRDVFRETLRLYPPVPMMVRSVETPVTFRERLLPKKAQVVLSPWHLQRHERLWDNPDGFDPTRWETGNGKTCQRDAFIPFSSGPRVCTGAGFAMVEGVLLLAKLVAAYRLEVVAEKPPIPVAQLTVRGKDGIWLKVSKRSNGPEHII